MSTRDTVLHRARHLYADDFAARIALSAPTDRDAAAALSRLLRNGGCMSSGVRIDFTAKGIDYQADGEAGHLTYLDLARKIRGSQMALDFGGAA